MTTSRLSNLYPALDAVPELVVFPDEQEDEPHFLLTPETLVGNGPFDPLTIILAGRRGRGKTAALTYIGNLFRQSYAYHGLDVHIAANYNTDVAHDGWADPFILDEIILFPPWADNILILVDEAAAYFPRRRSLARAHLDFSTFLQQIRKRDIEMVFTTQFPGMLDDQMLINIDLYCMVDMWPRSGWNAGKYVDVKIWDWHGQFTGSFSRPKIPPEGPPTWRRRFHNVNQIFGHYNTKEVIGRLWASGDSRADVAEQYWDLDVAEQAPPPQLVAPPGSLLEYVMNTPTTFIIERFTDGAKAFDETIRTHADLERRLEGFGLWDIELRDKKRVAIRKDQA